MRQIQRETDEVDPARSKMADRRWRQSPRQLNGSLQSSMTKEKATTVRKSHNEGQKKTMMELAMNVGDVEKQQRLSDGSWI